MSNICQASTENDKHAIQQIPDSLGAFWPSTMTSTHDFFYATGSWHSSGTPSLNTPLVMANAPYQTSQRILALNPFNPFKPIDAIYICRRNSTGATEVGGYTNSEAAIYQGTGPYYMNNITQFKHRYKYYKVETSSFVITIRNIAGLNPETPPIPINLFAYHQNNTPTMPLLDLNSSTVGLIETRRKKVRALMINPMVSSVCGGERLGTAGTAQYTGGLIDSSVAFPYASEFTTTATFNNNESVASDPATVTNIKYWTLTGGTATTVPSPPENVNKLHFFVVPTGNTSLSSGDGYANLIFEIRAKYKITWRDHNPDDTVYTDLTTLTTS